LGFTGLHAGITAVQKYKGYISPKDAKRAYAEDGVCAATGLLGSIVKGARGTYYVVKSGLLGIGGTLDSLVSP